MTQRAVNLVWMKACKKGMHLENGKAQKRQRAQNWGKRMD